MNNETCIHGGISPVSLLESLHHSQGGSGRHRCPTCAFEEGFIVGSSGKWKSYDDYSLSIIDPEKCPQGSIAPSIVLKNLGENQGGAGRHKCTNCAFKQGFEVAILENNIDNIQLVLVKAPSVKITKKKRRFSPSKNIDFIEKELKNKHLGLLGELLVLHTEKKYLCDNNRPDLAEKVEHTSVVRGDGAGYDILSFNLKDEEKYIEVKTTRSNISRPFYLTSNEIEYSKLNNDNYFLYRLFDFDTNLNVGKYYKVQGDLYTKLNLEPILYLATPK
ncbi:DUF3883 domain-containing protein [uncultured Polaribacter sp.]|uniref:DUF3883 domain-containing protein n=1 Tax=uncultured Polaribacter sp. TaxID=174711 RepID=UPI002622FE3F|nr:DUF3883 domain-containing protein [uncultured Polaribacter sp.]